MELVRIGFLSPFLIFDFQPLNSLFSFLGVNAIETAHFDPKKFGLQHRSILCTMMLPHQTSNPCGHHIKFNPGLNLRPFNLPQSLLLCLKDAEGRRIELAPKSIIQIEILHS